LGHYKIVLKDIRKIDMLEMNPNWRTLRGKEENHQSSVGDAKKITCTNIVIIEMKK
jgi:hypothetical protein